MDNDKKERKKNNLETFIFEIYTLGFSLGICCSGPVLMEGGEGAPLLDGGDGSALVDGGDGPSLLDGGGCPVLGEGGNDSPLEENGGDQALGEFGVNSFLGGGGDSVDPGWGAGPGNCRLCTGGKTGKGIFRKRLRS